VIVMMQVIDIKRSELASVVVVDAADRWPPTGLPLSRHLLTHIARAKLNHEA
jgi:hypothetical protein